MLMNGEATLIHAQDHRSDASEDLPDLKSEKKNGKGYILRFFMQLTDYLSDQVTWIVHICTMFQIRKVECPPVLPSPTRSEPGDLD